MELAVYTINGEDTGRKVVVSDEMFAIEPNDHAIYLDVKQYLANQRQGTHKAKERNEVKGSSRKIKKQKGTGGARAGNIRNPLYKGGGRVFGPRPRDYRFKLNRKLKRLARRSALSYKLKANGLMVVENFNFADAKTKSMVAFKQNLKIADKKSLLVLSEPNKNIYLSSRNLPGTKVVTANELTTYDILNAASVVFVESALELIEKNLQ